jgi:hypothetical protein
VENDTDQKNKQLIPTASAILDDGTIVEMTFQLERRQALLAI